VRLPSRPRAPEQLDGGDRIREALQGELADRAVLDAAPATAIRRTTSAARIWPALALRAQPGCFDHRVAEVVLLFMDHLAAAQPDPQPHPVEAAPVVLLDGLLHGDAAGECGGGRREHDHDPVPEVLHLHAPRVGDGLAQNGEMRPPHIVGALGREALGERRRADDVGEEDCHILGGHRHHPACTTETLFVARMARRAAEGAGGEAPRAQEPSPMPGAAHR